MTLELKSYPTYKTSGVELLGDVPEHWEVRRLKTSLQKNDSGYWGTAFSSNGPFVLRSNEQTVDGWWRIKDPARRNLTRTEEIDARLEVGDLVITKSSGSEKHIGKTSLVSTEIAQMRCCFSNFMQRIRPKSAVEPKLVWYLLNNPIGREQLIYGSSTTTGLANLNGNIVGNVLFGFPPLPEQVAIVRYLDHHDRLIRRYIRAKEKLVALLEEQKQAIIHRAVTRGLDPNVHLKPSGVEWLGDVPEHWEVRRIKNLARLKSGNSITALDINESGPYPVYGGNGLRGFTSTYTHQGEFVLIGRQGALCGNINYAKGEFWASEHAVVALPLVPYDVLWFGEMLRTMNLNQYSISAAQPGLSVERIQNLSISVPPLSEQTVIARHLMVCTADLVRGVAAAQHEIELLGEYRTRLIADVVTGKLDVRGIDLPELDDGDEPDELEDLEEASGSDEMDKEENDAE